MAIRALSKPGSTSRPFLRDATVHELEAIGGLINDRLSPEEGERILLDLVNWVRLRRGNFLPAPIMFLALRKFQQVGQIGCARSLKIAKFMKDSSH